MTRRGDTCSKAIRAQEAREQGILCGQKQNKNGKNDTGISSKSWSKAELPMVGS